MWKGARTLIHLPGDGTAWLCSAGVDVTPSYPELGQLGAVLPRGLVAVLDGEVIAPDPQGRPSVERLHQRRSLHHPASVARACKDLPVQLVLYDILYLGEPTVHLPYTARRALLDDLAPSGPHLAMPPYWPAMATEALHYTREEGHEGIVAKRLTSPYLPGRRSRDWINVKHLGPTHRPDAG